MSLGLATRELELIIIAHDRASSTLARVGGGLAILGAGMTRLGMEGVEAFIDMTAEALEFDKQVRLAYTQVFDKSKVTMQEVDNVIKNVARSTAAPIEELQEGLFDVFSSLDTNAKQAEELLMLTARAAVAGQADVRSALIPTIAVINAYNRPLSDTENILDVQFKTVQKGILTYQELTSNIGKAIPAAVSAGQNFESLGAMLAFMTRGGLNAAMASTSAARGLELLARPAVTKALQEQGFVLTDQAGNFLQIHEIINQLGEAWGHLTAPERKQKFQETFGTGTIQARRFFDLAIPNFRELNDLVTEFGDSAGEMNAAYETMSQGAQVQLEALRNRWQILRIEIGESFIPEITDRLIPALDEVLSRWEALDDEQKKQISEYAAMAAAGLTLAGALTTLAGITVLVGAIWKVFLKVAVTAGIALGKLSLVIGGLAYLGFWVYKNWEKVSAVLEDVWDKALVKLKELWKWAQDIFYNRLLPLFKRVAEDAAPLWDRIVSSAKAAWPLIVQATKDAVDFIRTLIEQLITFITWLWDKGGKELVMILGWIWDLVAGTILDAIRTISAILKTLTAILTGDWGAAWGHFLDVVKHGWALFIAFFKLGFLKHLPGIILSFIKWLGGGRLLHAFGNFFYKIGQGFDNLFYRIMKALYPVTKSHSVIKKGFARVVSNLSTFFYKLTKWTDDLQVLGIRIRRIWETFKLSLLGPGTFLQGPVIIGAWNNVVKFIERSPFKAFFGSLTAVIVYFTNAFWTMKDRIIAAWATIVERFKLDDLAAWFKESFGPIADWIGDAWGNISSAFKGTGDQNIFERLFGGGKEIFGSVQDVVGNAIGFIVDSWNRLKDFSIRIWDNIANAWNEFWNSDILVTLRNTAAIIGHLIRITFGTMVREIHGKFLAAKNYIIAVWDAIGVYLVDKWNNIVSWAKLIWGGLVIAFKWISEQFKTYIVPGWEWIRDRVIAISEWIGERLIAIWEWIKETAGIVWENIKQQIINPFTLLIAWMAINLDPLWTALAKAWEWVRDQAAILWEQVYNNIIGPVLRAWEGLLILRQNIKNWWNNLWSDAAIESGRVRAELAAIDPRVRRSPSIIEQVDAGMLELLRILISGLTTMTMRVAEKIITFRDILSKLDPRTRFSPPITTLFRDGLQELGTISDSEFAAILGNIKNHTQFIRAELTSMIPENSFRHQLAELRIFRDEFNEILAGINADNPLSLFGWGGYTPKQILQGKAFQEAGSDGTLSVHPELTPSTPTVQIGELHTNADPKEVANEIAWQILTRAN